MDKLFKLLALLLVGINALGFQSCGSDDDDAPTMDNIIGSWKFTEVSTNGGVSFSRWPIQATGATFYENGTYTGYGYFGNGSGTWKKKGNTIVTYVDDEEYLRYEIKEQTSATATLIISITGASETLWVRCIKTSGGANGDTRETISKAELENVTSFVYDDGYAKTYIKFRDGHLYTKEVTNDGSVFNEDDIIYNLNGSDIELSFHYHNPSGKIYKVKFNDGKMGVVMDLEGTYGIATWLSKTIKESTYSF